MSKEQFEVPETTFAEVFYGKGGNECDERECFARHYIINGGSTYYVWHYKGSMYDPNGGDSIRRHSPMAKLTKVTKETFDLYIKFLKTRNQIYLTMARRNSR